jgi:alcohol dehydrogenase class IV
MNNFQFFLNTKIDFGINRIQNLSNYCKEFNAKKVMIVTDSNLLNLDFFKSIIESLNTNNINYYIFSKVEPNPRVNIIDQGAIACKKEACDLIIGIGGGSSIDTAKGIAVMAVNEGSCYDYLDGRGELKKEIKIQPLSIIAIPTTSGTGSEVSMYSVITDAKNIKDSISSTLIYPKIALVDPELTLDLPPFITACTGLDVLGHALEAYTSNIQNDITNIWALEAIKLVFDYLPQAVNKGDIESRTKMALASVIAGSAMSHCGATIPHALGCPLSGHCNLPHGLTVGLLQIPMIQYNKDVLKEKFHNVMYSINPQYILTNKDPGETLVEMISTLFDEINFKPYLDDLNIIPETFTAMVQDASVHGCLTLNKKSLDKDGIRAIYNTIIH